MTIDLLCAVSYSFLAHSPIIILMTPLWVIDKRLILTIILVNMTNKHFHLVYDTEFVAQMRFIERKYHSLVRTTIEQQLVFEPDIETRNRKELFRETAFGARWELRFGTNNELRLFYSIYPDIAEVHILAMGIRIRERLYIGGKEVKL